jgi:uncharacterized membrane protein
VSRRFGWAVMAFLAVGVGAYAVAILAAPTFGAPFFGARLVAMPLAVYGHVVGGAVALIIGAFQVNALLRQRSLARHRWLGRIYVTAVLIAAPSGLVLATVSEGGWIAHAGFGLLAVLWFATTAMAYGQIRARNIVAHRQWMMRSYALTLAAVTLRLYLPTALIAGVPFEPAYQAISWLCWVPNLIVAEWLIQRTARKAQAPSHQSW